MAEKKKTILVACGTAVATSTVMAVGIEEALRARKIFVQMRQCKTAEIRGHLEGVDLIVTTTSITGDFGVPIIRSLAFLTGIGKDKLVDDIVAALNK